MRATHCRGCGVELPSPVHGHRKWCSEACRKRTLYGRPCLDCGKMLNGSDGNGPHAPRRCVKCAAVESGAKRKVWTRQAILNAIRAFADCYGQPPAIIDWSPHVAEVYKNDPGRAWRYREDGCWPSFTTVFREFGSWNAAIKAAGFAPRAAHGGDGNELLRRRRAA